MKPNYTHPFDGISELSDLTVEFRKTFNLQATHHNDTATVKLEQHWTENDILELIERTPFEALAYDTTEVTIVHQNQLE